MARFNHELLRGARVDLGLTQDQAAEALGVDVRTYRRYEGGGVNEGGGFRVRHAARRRRLRPDLPPAARAVVAYEWGLYAGALGDLELACRCYEAHGRAAGALDGGDGARRAMGLRTLAYARRLRGDLGRAAVLLDESVEAARRAGSAFHLARGLALLAAVEHDLGRPDAAARRLEGARAVDPTPVARRAFWEAELRLGRGERREAEALARRGLDYCARRGWPGHVAHGHVLLGEAALEGGDLAAAGERLDLARPWALDSGEVEMALRCHRLAARLALARGDVAGAARHAALGLEPADLYGFRPFAARLRLLAAEADVRAGALEGALARARAAAAVAGACGDAWAAADAAHVLGVALAAGGDRCGARRSLGAALDARQRLGHPGAVDTRAALARLAL